MKRDEQSLVFLRLKSNNKLKQTILNQIELNLAVLFQNNLRNTFIVFRYAISGKETNEEMGVKKECRIVAEATTIENAAVEEDLVSRVIKEVLVSRRFR